MRTILTSTDFKPIDSNGKINPCELGKILPFPLIRMLGLGASKNRFSSEELSKRCPLMLLIPE